MSAFPSDVRLEDHDSPRRPRRGKGLPAAGGVYGAFVAVTVRAESTIRSALEG